MISSALHQSPQVLPCVWDLSTPSFIGICLIGGSNDAGDWENNFTSDQFVSLKALILNLQSKYKITYIIGHNEIEPKKECPSFNVQDWLEKENINVV